MPVSLFQDQFISNIDPYFLYYKLKICPVVDKTKSKIFNSKDLIAYFLVAGTGAVVQLLCSSLFKDWFGLTFQESILPAYAASFIVGFALTKLFAFNARKTNQTRREMVKFLMVAVFSGFVTYIFSTAAYYVSDNYFEQYNFLLPWSKKYVNVNEMACYIVGMGFSFISNYILHKTFTFKSTGFYNRLKVLIR